VSDSVVEKSRVVDVIAQLRESGMYRDVDLIQGDTYRDMSTIVVCPTRGGRPIDDEDSTGTGRVGTIPVQVVQSWMTLIKPPNVRSGWIMVAGDEVATAYNRAIRQILEKNGTFKYILTLEDDNIVPPHALVALLQSIELGPYDAVGGVYFMKGGMAIPMAFGRPGARDAGGEIDMSPVSVSDAIIAPMDPLSGKVVEVNGLACGCTLWRLDLFREMEYPWFRTFTRVMANGDAEVMTQDLYFARKCVERGKRFALDARVLVGHLDSATGLIY
jgi:hypothetical protein